MTIELKIENGVGTKVAAQNLVTELLERAMALEVTDDASLSEMSCAYKEARDLADMVDIAKKLATAPQKKVIDEANAVAKDLHAKLDKVIEISKERTASYLKLRENTIQDAQKRAKKLASDLGDHSYVQSPIVEISPVSEGAVAYFSKELRYRVVDINLVPRQYMQINDNLIKQNIKLGVNEIPGLEIYEEEIFKMRAK